MLSDHWLSPSGGLVYHLRALRHRHGWQPYADRLAGWLQAWSPPCRSLVLIGPSAGWTLPAALKKVMPYLVEVLGLDEGAKYELESEIP